MRLTLSRCHPPRTNADQVRRADALKTLLRSVYAVRDLIDPPQDFAARGLYDGLIAHFFFQKCARHGRINRDVIVATINLVLPHDSEFLDFPGFIFNFHPGPEKHLSLLLS